MRELRLVDVHVELDQLHTVAHLAQLLEKRGVGLGIMEGLARRIVELEKPAHTVFDVKFYWEMFRIGEARLQLDTLIDRGSRAPQLLPGLILGRGFVGENHLAAPDSEVATDRYSLGRDPLARNPRKEKRP